MFQDGSQQEIQCETSDSNGLILRRNKIKFTKPDKDCKIFLQTWQALKTNHPSRG